MSELTYDRVEYDHADAHAPRRAPAEESFWVASTNGWRVRGLGSGCGLRVRGKGSGYPA
jgi:hypothetical protein